MAVINARVGWAKARALRDRSDLLSTREARAIAPLKEQGFSVRDICD